MGEISFKIELVDNNIIKTAFESITHIVDEVVCNIDSEGFRVTALDRSHVTFVSLNLQSEVFDSFECNVPTKICLDTQEFSQILKRCKNNDVLVLSSDMGNLIVECKGDVDRLFKIRLIDVDYEQPAPPNLNPPVSVEVPSNLMKDCLTDMELFNENLKFTINNEYFIADSNGEFGDSEFKYLHGENIDKNVHSNFSIDKLKDIFRASKFSDMCAIGLGNDMPLILKFELNTNNGCLEYLLAPRIEVDE